MLQRQTAHVPSHVPVGQPLYIFDVGTHKFDGTLYRSCAHTHTSSLSSILWTPQADDTSTLFSWIAPSIYMLYPGLYFTHIAYVTFFIDPPPKKTLTNPHTISLYVCTSLTQPHIGGVRIQEENRCTVHVLTPHAQPHPCGYTVELISL